MVKQSHLWSWLVYVLERPFDGNHGPYLPGLHPQTDWEPVQLTEQLVFNESFKPDGETVATNFLFIYLTKIALYLLGIHASRVG